MDESRGISSCAEIGVRLRKIDNRDRDVEIISNSTVSLPYVLNARLER